VHEARVAASLGASFSVMRYVALEKENDQKDDQDEKQNATTDIHLQPPWSRVIRLDTRFAEEINPIHVRVHKVLKTEACDEQRGHPRFGAPF
jgi:hypothetical protein